MDVWQYWNIKYQTTTTLITQNERYKQEVTLRIPYDFIVYYFKNFNNVEIMHINNTQSQSIF